VSPTYTSRILLNNYMKKNAQLHTVAVFDVDSASVAVSVVSYNKQNAIPVKEIFSKRVIIDEKYLNDFFAHTLRTLDDLATQAIQQTHTTVCEVYLVVGAPWIASQKRVVHYERKQEFVLTSELVEEALAKEERESISRNLDFHKFEDLHFFERRTVDMLVNGYPTLHPFESKTKIKSFDIHNLVSVISGTTKDSFTHIIERIFGQEPIFISNAFVMLQTAQNFLPHIQSTTMLDIGGTNTQIYVLIDGHLQSMATFPIGMSTILNDLSERLSIGKQKARSLLRLYTQSSLDEAYRIAITKAMDETFYNWYQELFAVTDMLSREKLLPSTWSFVAPKDLEEWIAFHLLRSEGIHTHLKARSSLQLVNISQILDNQSREFFYDHITDTEMIPLVDVVGRLLQGK